MQNKLKPGPCMLLKSLTFLEDRSKALPLPETDTASTYPQPDRPRFEPLCFHVWERGTVDQGVGVVAQLLSAFFISNFCLGYFCCFDFPLFVLYSGVCWNTGLLFVLSWKGVLCCRLPRPLAWLPLPVCATVMDGGPVLRAQSSLWLFDGMCWDVVTTLTMFAWALCIKSTEQNNKKK